MILLPTGRVARICAVFIVTLFNISTPGFTYEEDGIATKLNEIISKVSASYYALFSDNVQKRCRLTNGLFF